MYFVFAALATLLFFSSQVVQKTHETLRNFMTEFIAHK